MKELYHPVVSSRIRVGETTVLVCGVLGDIQWMDEVLLLDRFEFHNLTMFARFFAPLRMPMRLLESLPKYFVHPQRAMWFKKKKSLGNDLLSQGAAPQVPSALADLTTGFGM